MFSGSILLRTGYFFDKASLSERGKVEPNPGIIARYTQETSNCVMKNVEIRSSYIPIKLAGSDKAFGSNNYGIITTRNTTKLLRNRHVLTTRRNGPGVVVKKSVASVNMLFPSSPGEK